MVDLSGRRRPSHAAAGDPRPRGRRYQQDPPVEPGPLGRTPGPASRPRPPSTAVVAAVVGFASGLVLLRTQGLTLLMLTLCTMALLGEGANMAHDYTGGFDGLPSLPIAPVFGVFQFNPLYANTQYLYSLAVLLVCFLFVRTLVYSPFGQSLTGIR